MGYNPAEYNKQYYEKNKEKILNKSKIYKKENNAYLQRTKKICNHMHKFPSAWIFYSSLLQIEKEEFREQFEVKFQEYLQKNKIPYKIRKAEYDKKYVENNREKVRKYHHQYYKKNLDKEKAKLNRLLHKEERKVYDKNRRSINSKNRRTLNVIKQCPALFFVYTQFSIKEKQNIRNYIDINKPDTHRKFLIYGIYNKNNPDEILYIGQHTYYKENDGYMGSGVEIRKLYDSVGIDNFSRIVFEKNLDENLAGLKERFYIQKYREMNQAKLNIANGGHPSLRAKLKTGQTIEEYRKESRRLTRLRRADKIKQYEVENKDRINKIRKYRALLKKCPILKQYYNNIEKVNKKEFIDCFAEKIEEYLINNKLNVRQFCSALNKRSI